MLKSALPFFPLFLVGGALGLVAACSSDTCLDDDSCGSATPGTDSGADGDRTGDGKADGSDVAPPGCDPSQEAKDAPACVVSAYGQFVDGVGGADTNPGTKDQPKKSIGAALGSLTSTQRRVYVCGAGPYAEKVKLTLEASLYGGFACGTWSYDGTRAQIAPAERGYAVEIANVGSRVVLSDVELTSKDGVDAGESSIAVFVRKSADVNLVRVKATAGKGVDGAAGGTAPTNHFAGSLDGNAATGAFGGLQKICECKAHGTSTGGGGGSAGTPAMPGAAGSSSPVAAVVSERTSAPGTGYVSAGKICTGGIAGSDGSARQAGAGAASLGDLTEAGFAPAAGGAAETSSPGAGGGGGGGGPAGGAGGGGCGGCGGSGGLGGGGGGSSVAVLALDSMVLFVGGELVATTSGKGGGGSTGEAGDSGGENGSGGGCPGGIGGNGAGGGGGGGGAGGNSVAVLYKGSAPWVDEATKTTFPPAGGAGGAVGAGGVGGTNALGSASAGTSGTKGRDGVAAATHAL